MENGHGPATTIHAGPSRTKENFCAADTDFDYLAKSYRDRAGTYDLDVGRRGYYSPIVVTELATVVQTAYLARKDARYCEGDAH
ncbi:MAG: hypothetical protein E5X37_29300 [Mesorhizobium sp.]|nr:MAG: hypothetical protein E5X37_29300 [Mesorhizobium sp.]